MSEVFNVKMQIAQVREKRWGALMGRTCLAACEIPRGFGLRQSSCRFGIA
jgi:hypothetical protein